MLSENGLRDIVKVAHEVKDVKLLFLIDIYRMLRQLLEKQNNASNGSNNRADSSNL